MRWIWIMVFGVSGCALLPERVASPAPVRTDITGTDQTRPQSRPADGVAAPAAAVPAGALGVTIAALGNAAEPGLWLKTPLVNTTRPGRVTFPETGQSINVTLIPIEGPTTAGSRLSLAAMQGLGVPLTGLVSVEVSAN